MLVRFEIHLNWWSSTEVLFAKIFSEEQPEQPEKISARSYATLLRKDTINIIANSTVCVFQWNKSWYTCYFCKESFINIDELRRHNDIHTLKELDDRIISQQNRMVKIEISQLFCKICKKESTSIQELRNHLKKHEIHFNLNEDLLIPFKINQNLHCQLCNESFDSFWLLNIHMNKHYKNHVCPVCGTTFSNSVLLTLHKIRSHRIWRCIQCDVTFNTKAEKKTHDISIHKQQIKKKLRFPCKYCQERFSQENNRTQHLVDAHGLPKPEHKCQLCFKVFITRSLRNNHIKNVHQKEKNKECDVCHRLFYAKSDVTRHKVTHTKEKKVACESCDTLFATKDSLRKHIKRIHTNVPIK
ncbi:Zinc finger protein 254 [Papilio xuthus]|uniref:Zinc finger protein 254 n=1 Tax=Papilio xuthus TaxID=66420 RepID=A0A0N1IBG1_PAPXU|nr:Zinc finger protein 254 [Papilio xuthus]